MDGELRNEPPRQGEDSRGMGGAMKESAVAGVRGVEEIEFEAMRWVEHTATGLIDGGRSIGKELVVGVGDLGGELLTVARQTLKSAVAGGADVGSDLGTVAVRAAGGAVEAVGTVGNAAVRTARDLLVGAVGGLKDVLSSALPQKSARSVERPMGAGPTPPGRGTA